MAEEPKRYDSLDGLRTISCLGIILMHLAANNTYQISGFIYKRVIPSFSDFVLLFMVLSAFGMCCGYYKKVLTGNIDFTEFYKRRYLKILPFFSCLVVLDLIVSFSTDSLYEGIADLSLTFGLFPNDIKVIGVGWFLGLVFAFYMIFPFYCVLIGSKKRAWIFMCVSLVLNFVLGSYFGLGVRNIVYSLCFFIAGGLLYLYKDLIVNIKWLISFPILLVCIIFYFLIGRNTYTQLAVSVSFVIFALGKGGKVLNNKFTNFISSISLEMYLSHMVMFRLIELFGINTIFGNGILQYIITCVIVLILVVAFSYIGQKFINFIIKNIKNKVRLNNISL